VGASSLQLDRDAFHRLVERVFFAVSHSARDVNLAGFAVSLIGHVDNHAVENVLVLGAFFVRSVADTQHTDLVVFELDFVMTCIGHGRVELGVGHGRTGRCVLQLDLRDLYDVVGSVLDHVASAGRTPAHVACLERDLVGFAAALLISAAIGLFSGLFVTRLKIPSFLVTLGMLLVVRGVALFVTDGFPQRTWSAGGQWLAHLLVGDFHVGPFRVYASLFWFIAAAIILGYVLTKSKFGNWIQAAGGNAVAARARGVNVNAVKVWLFVLSAVMSAFAGIISSIRTSAANPNSGTGYELEVIAMVVIGGTALTGGRGTILGTVLGILILRVMRNGIVLIGVPGLAYNIFIGAIILGMMALHSWLERRHQAGT